MWTKFQIRMQRAARITSLLVCVNAAAVSAQTQASVTDNDIMVGQSCQLTGPLAALTSEVRQGANLYFDKVNATGGIAGRKIRVVSLDDAYDPAKAAANTRSLIADQRIVALFQYAGTPPALAALPLVEEHRIPFVAPFTGSDALRQKFSRYVFNIKAGYAAELDAMVKQLSTVGVNRISVVYLNNAFGKAGLAAVESSAGTRGVSLLATAPLELDGSNIVAVVSALSAGTPDAIIVISAGKPSVDFVDAYLRAGHRSTFYMLSVISNSQLVKGLGDKARGIIVSQVVPAPWNQSVPIVREFQTLAAASGLKEFTFSQMEGFLSAKFLVEGLRRTGGKPTRENLIQAFESMRSTDLGGYPVELSSIQHSSGKYVDLLILGRDGKFTK